jgi:RHS repeat-associated protein
VRASYAYDVQGRMTEARVEERGGGAWVLQDGTIERYAYDGDGRRISREIVTPENGAVVQGSAYRYDDISTWNVLYEEDTTDSANARRYLYDRALHKLAVSEGGQSSYFQSDSLGSVLGATDENGSLARADELMRYGDYGELLADEAVLPTADAYTGYEHDSYTGLSYARHRYYDAATGTFLTPDPYPADRQDMLNLHRYLYVQANPINMTDPLGLFDWATGTIEWGDTLSQIAWDWGTDIDEFMRYNPQITNPNLIYAGTHLNLPPCKSAKCQALINQSNANAPGTNDSDCGRKDCGFNYTIKSGDTLSTIGAPYGLSWESLYDANKHVIGGNPNLIYPGQRIYIPCTGSNSNGGSPNPVTGGTSNLQRLANDNNALKARILEAESEVNYLKHDLEQLKEAPCNSLGCILTKPASIAALAGRILGKLVAINQLSAQLNHIQRKIEIIPRGAPEGGATSCYTYEGHGYARDCSGGNGKVIATHTGTVIDTQPEYCGSGAYIGDLGWVPCNGGEAQKIVVKSPTIDGEWYQTLYLHMKAGSFRVSRNTNVKQGTWMADVGNTGLSTGAHVHYEVRKNGFPQSSVSYIETNPNINW